MRNRNMEALINKAEYIIEKSHSTLLMGEHNYLIGDPLLRKLADLYAKRSLEEPRVKCVNLAHKLLDRLVRQEDLNCLIVNLHKGNEGYSIAVRLSSGIETETVRMHYDDDEFLSYVDNEQLPPMLLDLLDESGVEIFYSGCIVAEIRDFRRCQGNSYESRYVLLKPTTQSLATDVAAMTREKDWTAEERLHLEAEIVLQTSPPLTLSPSPLVAIINNRLHQRKYRCSKVTLRRAAKRFSQVALNRQKRFEEGPPPKCLRLHGFLSSQKKSIGKSIPTVMVPIMMAEPVASDMMDIDMKPHAELLQFYDRVSEDVHKLAQPLERVQDTNDNSLVFVEEYILETESQGRIYLTRLTISQRKTDEVFFGELYVDRDYQENKQNGSVCRFQLGTQQQVRRYIQQFKEIFTEEGRKSVTITHKVSGQNPRVIVTQGTRDKKELTEQLKPQQAAYSQHHQIQQQLHQIQEQAQQQQSQQLHQPQQVVGHHQQVQQSLLSSLNLGAQHGGQTAALSASVAPPGTPPNVIIVSNGEGGLKKSVALVSKPVTMTTPSLTSLISTQPMLQQTGNGPQGVVVGRNLSVSQLVASRPVVSASTCTIVGVGNPSPSSGQPTKVAVNISAGTVGAKLSHSALAAQLSRPPPYVHTVTPSKSQVATLVEGGAVNQSRANLELLSSPPSSSSSYVVSSSSSFSTQNMSGLQALLAGTPSADSPIAPTRESALLERLTGQNSTLKVRQQALQDDSTPTLVKMGPTTGGTSSPQIVSVSTTGSFIGDTSKCTSSAPTITRSDGTTVGGPPPNVSLANLPSLSGINVGLQNLGTNLQGIQNVQVSIPGFPVPIPISLNMPSSGSNSGANTTTAAMLVSSPPPASVATKSSVSTAVTSTATVMITSRSSLPPGQIIQLPVGQLNGSQLAAQLTKSLGQSATGTSSIPVLQGVGASLIAPVRGTPSGGVGPQTVQVAVPASQIQVAKHGTGGQLSWQLQQKQMAIAAKRQSQQQPSQK